MNKKKNFVVIGGGTGLFTLLKGLRTYPINITAIVTMSDSGGSSGVLRDEQGVLPPGDTRRCLVALANSNKLMRDLFNYRFEEGGLEGHSFGNLFITALSKVTGSFERAIKESGKILSVYGRVIPVTVDDVNLCAELKDGSIVKGEGNISFPDYDASVGIKRVYFDNEARATSSALRAIANADAIVIGPGSLFTSIVPNLLVNGIVKAIRKSKATKFYISSLMTQFTETHSFSAKDHLDVVESYLGKEVIDYILVNNKMPDQKLLEKYAEEHSYLVENDLEDDRVVFDDFINERILVRHNSKKLGKKIIDVYFSK